MEHKVTWRYLSYDPPFNTRRTLDQFGYPNLLDTRARDDDQMLYKMTKLPQKPNYRPRIGQQSDDDTESDSDDTLDESIAQGETIEGKYEHLRDGKVLMIDQVWLWIVDKGMFLSFVNEQDS